MTPDRRKTPALRRVAVPLLLAGVALVGLSACASMMGSGGKGPGAPAPLKSVDAARFYTGVWYEIGRLPMKLTDGCVAGATQYTPLGEGRVQVRDTCRKGSPTGKEQAIGGRGRILDPGANTRLRVRYLGVLVWEYRVLDRDEDYRWFISSDPSFDKLWIYTRDPNPSAALKAELKARAGRLGYDVNRLEFPEEMPR